MSNQLNSLTPVGTPINIVEIEKNELINAPLPIVKKWWTQTKKLKNAIPAVAQIIL